ncbi:MAG: hypothetical protein U0136_16295 [Bdellovibrionota bacterium]
MFTMSRTVTDERGATLVEGSFVLSVFLFGLLAGSDLLRVSYVYLSALHVVERSASSAALTASEVGLNRVDTIRKLIVRTADGMGISVTPQNVWVCKSADNDHCENQDAGAPRTDFRITVDYPIRLSLLNRDITLSVSASGRNERTL